MTVPTPTITAYFNLVGGSNLFVLDDPVKGVLDNATYLLAGNIATDITDDFRMVLIRRGRSRVIDEFIVGSGEVLADNRDRAFDPSYASSPFVGNLIPGKRFTVAANGLTIFDAFVDDIDLSYPISTDSTVEFRLVDALAHLGNKEFDDWTTTGAQTVGARFASILDRAEVAFPATRSIDTGTSTLQADAVSWGSNVLNYCQLVAKADLGRFFVAKDGTLTFIGRNHPVTGVGAPEFRDDIATYGSGIRYSDIGVDYGRELLFNRVSVDATGFTKQTVFDQASIDKYGTTSTLSVGGLPLDSQAQALDLANYLLNLYKDPKERFSTVTVLLHDPNLSPADISAVLTLDIGSVIRVVYTPNGIGSAIDRYCMVEGIEHTLTPMFHQVVLSVSNLADGLGSGQPFILDDPTYGVLDTVGAGLLAF